MKPAPGFLRHITACNSFNGEGFMPFLIHSARVGWVRPAFAEALLRCSDRFTLEGGEDKESTHEALTPTPLPRGEGLFADAPATGERLHVDLGDLPFEARNQWLGEIQRSLLDQGVIDRLHGEQFPIYDAAGHGPLGLIDRAAAPWFGIRAFGQHLNGFVRDRDQIRMWIAQRAMGRVNFPGHLDNLAAGGLPYGISLHDNLLKECHEEASIPAEIARHARPVGAITYLAETARGCKPDTLYCYDLELPGDFTPRCNDDEVESFRLMPIEEVAELVESSDRFKLNCNLVIIDFLIRHGLIDPQHPEYTRLAEGLHRPLCE